MLWGSRRGPKRSPSCNGDCWRYSDHPESFSADAFRQMVADEPSLGDYIGTLQQLYRLPRLGFVTQGHGRLEGHDAISCVLSPADRRQRRGHARHRRSDFLDAPGWWIRRR